MWCLCLSSSNTQRLWVENTQIFSFLSHDEASHWLSSKWHSIPSIVHYFWNGAIRHYKRNRVPFGMQTLSSNHLPSPQRWAHSILYRWSLSRVSHTQTHRETVTLDWTNRLSQHGLLASGDCLSCLPADSPGTVVVAWLPRQPHINFFFFQIPS